MEEKDTLAALEEDVERNRVAKNPFEPKFTELVRLGRDKGISFLFFLT